ncbi:helix-turn-helix domain-containing protein [Streptomyces sp. NPDC085460]|uniref:helix-turn-helix domain-containing protein n=1 Tax=Streptomyces sp. NPDC085460 TaxID=3365723 RepID=UPI0037D35C62
MSQTSRGSETAPPSTAPSLPTPKERRRLREALSLSEEQVAEAMGVTKATVKAWETGRSSPRGRKREAYAKLLAGTETATGPEPAERERAPEPRPQERPAAPSPAPGAPVRPKAAAKRAAKPPRGPSPAPSIGASGRRSKPEPRPERRQAQDPVPVRVPAEAAGPARDREHEPEGPEATAPESSGLTPEQAFDALYGYAAPGLVHQTYLLTGRRRLSRESVEHAFHHAWEHWPEVAVDPDPVGWVRAAAYEYALSPWHRLRRAHKHPDSPPTEPGRRALLGALLDLPAPYRRTLLLYDGLGLDLPETAAETEASTPAAANRLLYAREEVGRAVPELAEPEALQRRLAALVTEAPSATLPGPHTIRGGSERRIRLMTRTVAGVTAVLIGVTALSAWTAPTRYIPELAPGQVVNGVPVRGGPQKLGEEDVELRDKLRSEPNPGPERLIPAAE